jgi:predicted secreted protein
MSLKVGQVISLKLQEHVDGGYVWQFSKQPATGVLSVVSDESLPPSPAPSSTASPPTVGATGIHRWTFRATGAGTTGFTVVERRPNDANPLHDYSLTVVVSP